MRVLLCLALVGLAFGRPSEDFGDQGAAALPADDDAFLGSLLGEAPQEAPQEQTQPQQTDDEFLSSLGVGAGDLGVDPGAEVVNTAPEGTDQDSAEQRYVQTYDPDTEYERCGENKAYECVPYYLCREDEIITDGAGIIDIRFGNNKNNNDLEETFTHSECTKFEDVCCGAPEKVIEPEPIKYQPQCGRRNDEGINARIVGFKDHEAQFGEFPWMAAVLRKDVEYSDTDPETPIERKIFVCGGSLIHPQVVMTGAHCLSTYNNNFQVRLGEWDTQKQTEFYKHVDVDVAFALKHPDFGPKNLTSDVALLFLTEPVELFEHIDTICLPEPTPYGFDSEVNFAPGTYCTASGWGKNFFDEGQYQTILKQVDLPLVSRYDCQSALRTTRLGRRFRLSDTFLCAGGETATDGDVVRDTCTGDGGSPLVCKEANGRYVQTGIVAWGIGCGENGIPGVYADVSKFVYWIDRQITEYFQYAQSYFGYDV